MEEYQTSGHPPLELYFADKTHLAQKRTQCFSYSPLSARSEESLQKLKEWHESVADTPFIFKEEALKYCMSDSILLAMCAEKVEDAILELTENDISLLNSSSFTLASLTMTIFKHHHMNIPMGIVPQQGFFHFQLLDTRLTSVVLQVTCGRGPRTSPTSGSCT